MECRVMEPNNAACMDRMSSIRASLLRIKGELADMKRLDPEADFFDFHYETDVMIRGAENYIADCIEEVSVAA